MRHSLSSAAHLVILLLVFQRFVTIHLDLGCIALLVGALDCNVQIFFVQEEWNILLQAANDEQMEWHGTAQEIPAL